MEVTALCATMNWMKTISFRWSAVIPIVKYAGRVISVIKWTLTSQASMPIACSSVAISKWATKCTRCFWMIMRVIERDTGSGWSSRSRIRALMSVGVPIQSVTYVSNALTTWSSWGKSSVSAAPSFASDAACVCTIHATVGQRSSGSRKKVLKVKTQRGSSPTRSSVLNATIRLKRIKDAIIWPAQAASITFAGSAWVTGQSMVAVGTSVPSMKKPKAQTKPLLRKRESVKRPKTWCSATWAAMSSIITIKDRKGWQKSSDQSWRSKLRRYMSWWTTTLQSLHFTWIPSRLLLKVGNYSSGHTHTLITEKTSYRQIIGTCSRTGNNN